MCVYIYIYTHIYVCVCVCVCIMEYYLAIKRNEIMPFAETQIGIEIVIQSEVLDWCIAMNKASGSDGIPAELFKILKDDALKVLHSIC